MERQYAYADPKNVTASELKSWVSQVLYENDIKRCSDMSIRTLLSISKWTAAVSNLSSQVNALDKKVCDFF